MRGAAGAEHGAPGVSVGEVGGDEVVPSVGEV